MPRHHSNSGIPVFMFDEAKISLILPRPIFSPILKMTKKLPDKGQKRKYYWVCFVCWAICHTHSCWCHTQKMEECWPNFGSLHPPHFRCSFCCEKFKETISCSDELCDYHVFPWMNAKARPMSWPITTSREF